MNNPEDDYTLPPDELGEPMLRAMSAEGGKGHHHPHTNGPTDNPTTHAPTLHPTTHAPTLHPTTHPPSEEPTTHPPHDPHHPHKR